MSLQALIWALRVPKSKTVDDSALRTLAIMADFANEHGVCWPTRATLATARSVSPETIKRHVRALFEAGLIVPSADDPVTHLPGNRRPNVWQLCLPTWGVTDDPPVESRGVIEPLFGGSSGDPQNPIEPIRESNTQVSPMRATAKSAVMADRPDVECVHEHPATWYWDKRRQRQLPRCPYCRRDGLITLPTLTEEPAHA